jgi:hypothetical protein
VGRGRDPGNRARSRILLPPQQIRGRRNSARLTRYLKDQRSNFQKARCARIKKGLCAVKCAWRGGNHRLKGNVSPTRTSLCLTVPDVPEALIPTELCRSIPTYSRREPPVFFGHYWLRAEAPCLLEPNAACLGYSVAAGGFLAAYSWAGEKRLKSDRFTISRGLCTQICR